MKTFIDIAKCTIFNCNSIRVNAVVLKKKELVKPVQDKVFDAVEKVAKDHRLQMVFDKSGELVLIYTDPIHDYTDYVLEELGLGDENDIVQQ